MISLLMRRGKRARLQLLAHTPRGFTIPASSIHLLEPKYRRRRRWKPAGSRESVLISLLLRCGKQACLRLLAPTPSGLATPALLIHLLETRYRRRRRWEPAGSQESALISLLLRRGRRARLQLLAPTPSGFATQVSPIHLFDPKYWQQPRQKPAGSRESTLISLLLRRGRRACLRLLAPTHSGITPPASQI